MWETILVKNVLPVVVMAVMAWVGKAFSEWTKTQKELAEIQEKDFEQAADDRAKRQAYEALEAGVAKVQVDFVEAAKKAATDGKLTKDEIENAKRVALKTAVEIATGPALSILVDMAWNATSALIEKILGKNKKEN